MENRNIFWGVLLVAIGSLFILDNMDLLNFSFSALFDLWPLLLVGWGISMLPTKPIIKTTISIAIVIFALAYAATSDKNFWWENQGFENLHGLHFNVNDDHDDEDISQEDETYFTYNFDQEMDSVITHAKLTMDVAAGKFRINEPENEHLISFNAYSNIGSYNSNMVSNGHQAEINISMENNHSIEKGTNRNRANIKLNPEIIWELDFNVGAADFKGDLRKFKVSEIDIDGGASSVKLSLSDLQEYTYIKIDAAAASIQLRIPQDAACKVSSDSFLVDMDLTGFSKNKDGDYISGDYENNPQKINVDIDAALSKLRIERY